MANNGSRYVRQYGADYARDPRKDKSRPAWALWEIIDGRARRVGTARTAYEYLAFLFRGPVELKYVQREEQNA